MAATLGLALRQGVVLNPARSVVIVQRRLTHYRLPLFSKLRDLLAQQGIDLRLLVGEPTKAEKLKQDEGVLPWAELLPTIYLKELCWQPFRKQAAGADLVIVTQENKLVYNLLALTLARPRRFAFLGHGRNMQSDRPNGLKERFKRWTTNHVDWWFAYTDLSRGFVVEDGFSTDKVTVLNNSVDTSELCQHAASLSEAEKAAIRSELNLVDGPVGIFIGSLYREKRLSFLLEAARSIRRRIPGFSLLIVGEGADKSLVDDAALGEPWIKVIGARRARDKMLLLSVSDVMLNPGLVGLGILDSFVSGVPMITTDCGLHSPEIAYLRHGENGLMTANTLAAFSDAAVELLLNDTARTRLRQGALASSEVYTVERMAERFADGIVRCLTTIP